VVSNRPLYHSCPKHTKLLVAKAIVQAVQQQDPPGRFLEKTDFGMKLWREIDYKRCVHKTSQALREKDRCDDYSVPASKEAVAAGENALGELDAKLKELAEQTSQKNSNKRKREEVDLSDLANATLRRAGFRAHSTALRRTSTAGNDDEAAKRNFQFMKPAWMGQAVPGMPTSYREFMEQNGTGNQSVPPNKLMRTDGDESIPLPPDSMPNRQASMFNFLSGSSLFSRSNTAQLSSNGNQDRQQGQVNGDSMRASSWFSMAGGNRGSWLGSSPPEFQNMPNPSLLLALQASTFGDGMNQQHMLGQGGMNGLRSDSMANESMNNNTTIRRSSNQSQQMMMGPTDAISGDRVLRNASLGGPTNQHMMMMSASDALSGGGGMNPTSRGGQTNPQMMMMKAADAMMGGGPSNSQMMMMKQQQQPSHPMMGGPTNPQMMMMMNNASDNNSTKHLMNAASMGGPTNQQQQQQQMTMNRWAGAQDVEPISLGSNDRVRQPSNGHTTSAAAAAVNTASPPMNRLTSQFSDWFTSFLPSTTTQEVPPPPPPAAAAASARPNNNNVPPPTGNSFLERSVSSSIFGERGISSTFFGTVRSPSLFLNNLRSGVTSMFGGTADLEPVAIAERRQAPMIPPASSSSSAAAAAQAEKRHSLLDDYEESPMEAQLRMFSPF